jgi:hypothetical protein
LAEAEAEQDGLIPLAVVAVVAVLLWVGQKFQPLHLALLVLEALLLQMEPAKVELAEQQYLADL